MADRIRQIMNLTHCCLVTPSGDIDLGRHWLMQKLGDGTKGVLPGPMLTGDKPLAGPVMVSLPTHICFTLPQWVKCACILGPLHWRHERQAVSNHRRFCCLFNSLLSLRTQTTSKLCITGHLWGETIGYRLIPTQRTSKTKRVMMSWCEISRLGGNTNASPFWNYWIMMGK